MKNVKELFLSMAKAASERALKRDANRTTVVKGRAMFQYSDPLTGLTTGNTTDVSKTLKINCN